jgi:PAS domain S-box-containing protein
MSLRLKLLSGYLIFVAALLFLGLWGAWHVRELGDVARLILAENYDSVVAAQEMKEGLERQDSGAVVALLGQSERAVRQIRDQRALFDASFNRAANNITEPGEKELLDVLRRERDEYYRLVDGWLTKGGESPAQRAVYFRNLEPAFHKLRGHIQALLQLNQQAMRGKSERAATVARRSLLLTLTLAAVLVGTGLALAFFWAARIGRPVRALTTAATRIAGGDLSARAEVSTRDEVGLLAVEFNRMAERIRQLRRSDVGKLVVAQQTTAAALDLLDDPVLVTDEQGRITNLTPAAEKIFGPPRQSLGRCIEEVAPDSRLTMTVFEALKSPASGEAFGASLPVAFNGTTSSMRPRAKPMRDDNGRLLGAVLLLENISQQQELDRFKSEFIATAAQALQEPLYSVQMDLHAVLEGELGALSDEQRNMLLACREDSEKLKRIMRGLVELTELEAAEHPPEFENLNTADWLNAVAASWELPVESADLKFIREIPVPLPALQADHEMLRRVLGILLGNAIENTPRGGTITLSAAAGAHQVVIAVADTGRGIPHDFLPRIFSRFVKTPGSAESGAGLELAIARRLMELQKGQLGVQSQLDRGTVFSLTLPISRSSSPVLNGVAGTR